jgi:hypothetical protein
MRSAGRMQFSVTPGGTYNDGRVLKIYGINTFRDINVKRHHAVA